MAAGRSAALLGAACVLCVVQAAHAQAPSRPLRIVVPFAAGGSFDQLARRVAQKMSEAGQQAVVENRPGGGTVIATELVSKAPPDGRTVLIVGNSFTIQPAVQSKLAYDVQRDFAPLSLLTATSHVFTVHPTFNARTLPELVALARRRPGEVTFGTPGPGTSQHLTGAALALAGKMELTHVPYQGAAPASLAVMGGHVAMIISNIPDVTPHVRGGKMRALVVAAERRSEILPDVPTTTEAGLAEVKGTTWCGLVAPAATPRETLAQANAEWVRILRLSDVRQALVEQGLSVVASSQEEFGAMVRAELQSNARIVKAAGIRID